MADLSFAEVDALLKYDPETGKLFWKERSPEMFLGRKPSAEHQCARWNTRYAGTEAFLGAHPNGYLYGSLRSKTFKSHRVIWLLHTGEWPQGEIDHINGMRADNRIANLRCVSAVENKRNQRIRNDNKSGAPGVYWSRRFRKWVARIGVEGRDVHLGYFFTYEDALERRKAAEVEHGFHRNHGRLTALAS